MSAFNSCDLIRHGGEFLALLLSRNRSRQQADFRQRGGLSFAFSASLAVAFESNSPSERSAIYYDVQFASLSVRAPRAAHPAVDIYERIYR